MEFDSMPSPAREMMMAIEKYFDDRPHLERSEWVPRLHKDDEGRFHVDSIEPAAEWDFLGDPCCGNDAECCGGPTVNGVPREELVQRSAVVRLDPDGRG
jgi:hypothetical protein